MPNGREVTGTCVNQLHADYVCRTALAPVTDAALQLCVSVTDG